MRTCRRPHLVFHAPPCLALLAIVLPTASASGGPVRYRVTDLGTLGVTDSTVPSAINDAGQVVGTTYASGWAPVGPHFAFLYEDGRMKDVGILPGHGYGQAFGINRAAQVVGASYNAGIEGWAEARAFLYERGVIRGLDALPGGGGGYSEALGINDDGEIVGQVGGRAFSYRDGRAQDLGTLGGTSSRAAAINNAGQIVGSSAGADGGGQAFLYEGDMMRSLGTLPGRDSASADDINDAGQVVGVSGDRAFLYEGGRMNDMGALPEALWTEALAINNEGVSVGVSGGRAFLYQAGEMLDLNDLIPADSGWTLTAARDINDRGWIVGSGMNENGDDRGFLLIPEDGGPGPSPIPLPPAAWAALATMAGYGAVTRMRRRR